jgi:hypothetical protein
MHSNVAYLFIVRCKVLYNACTLIFVQYSTMQNNIINSAEVTIGSNPEYVAPPLG